MQALQGRGGQAQAQGHGHGDDRRSVQGRESSAATQRCPASILAVVESAVVRDLLTEIAVEEGYGLYCADGALEALAVLGRERPGVVVVDVEMPNARGLRFLNIFCQLEPHEDILCVALAHHPGVRLPPTVKVLSMTDAGRLCESLMTVLAQRFSSDEAPAGF